MGEMMCVEKMICVGYDVYGGDDVWGRCVWGR